MFMIYFFIGSALASFAFCLAGSLLNHTFSFYQRSQCCSCRTPLVWWQLVPLVSFLFLKGRCHFCGQTIDIDHFAIELFGAVCSVLLFNHHLNFSATLALLFVLILATSFDWIGQILPDWIQLIFFFFGICYNFLFTNIPWGYFVLILFVTVLLILFDQGWIGGADLKFICISVLFIPPTAFSLYIFWASFLGLIYAFFTSKTSIPFIPFLVLSFCYFLSS